MVHAYTRGHPIPVESIWVYDDTGKPIEGNERSDRVAIR